MPPRAKSASPYATHPGVLMESKAIAGLKGKTGRSLEEWVKLIRKSGPADTKARAAWLKAQHGLGTNYAAWIAQRAESGGDVSRPMDYDPASLVEQMFSGPKAALRPIYDRLLALAFELGPDVTVTPCATIVPFRRRHVIAQVKPSTNTRVDLGLALKEMPAGGRLIDTGGRAKGDRITHRIAVTSLAEIDAEVKRWLRKAYLMDA